MKILVCVKQVSESGAPPGIREDDAQLHFSENCRFELNPYDAYAVEAAVQLKETFDPTHIDVVTVGPQRAEDALRRALGMGADEGIHILDETPGLRIPAVTAAWISQVVSDGSYDLILTGIMSDDEMNAQTGPLIAQMSGLPCATSVISLEADPVSGICRIEREIEGGAKDLYEIKMPCVLALQTGINTPRYPSLSKVLRAKKKTFRIIEGKSLEPDLSSVNLVRLKPPENKMQGIVLEGTPEEKAAKLTDLLAAKTLF